MNVGTVAAVVSSGLCVGMILCLEGGYQLGHRHSRMDSKAHEGIGTIEAAVFALLGLLLGFAFAGATSRLDARRQLIVRETNTIGTAYLLLDVLPASDQPDLRRLFRDYLEARLRVYGELKDLDAAKRQITQAAQLQQKIWQRAVGASRLDPTQNTTRLVLPAITDMMDVTTARTVALQTRLPALILCLLVVVALLSALLAGYAMAKRKARSLLHVVLCAASVSITVYVVLDLDDPRSGLIRIDAADRVLGQLHDSIR